MAKNKNNRKCIICGKEYSYCPVCGHDLKKPSWYAIFCGNNCNEIYETVTTYRDGGCTIEDARVVLNGLDLSDVDKDGFNETTRKQIKEILGDVVKQEEVIVEAVEETPTEVKEVVVENKPEVKHENKYYGKNNFYNNKKNK